LDPGETDFDLVIVGGGMVGASLAVAVADSGLRVAIVEAFETDAEHQPSYDERTVALTWSARQIFTAMGVWSDMEAKGVEPIQDIHISDRGRFGVTHLSSGDVGTAALGYVVPTRVIGQVLAARLAASTSVSRIQPATANAIETDDQVARVSVAVAGQTRQLSTSLVVLADGGRSALGDRFEGKEMPYTQKALLCIVSVDRDHRGRAYERFTEEGPIALLPHSDRRYAVVWTGGEAAVNQRFALDDADFIDSLQNAFGDRAGTFSNPGPRKIYPLTRRRVAHPVDRRLVVIGNAAHTVHPVAGQGFNLGLRDVACLAEMLVNESRRADGDIGSASLLERYAASRDNEARRVSQFTHGLISTFASDFSGLRLARNLGLGLVELCPPAKRALLRRTMGLRSPGSTLAGGRPLDGHD